MTITINEILHNIQKRGYWIVTIGGFHLPADGGIYEAAIEPTLYELQKADPKYVVPCHCTGLKATNKIIQSMPEKFIQSAVGTTFQF